MYRRRHKEMKTFFCVFSSTICIDWVHHDEYKQTLCVKKISSLRYYTRCSVNIPKPITHQIRFFNLMPLFHVSSCLFVWDVCFFFILAKMIYLLVLYTKDRPFVSITDEIYTEITHTLITNLLYISHTHIKYQYKSSSLLSFWHAICFISSLTKKRVLYWREDGKLLHQKIQIKTWSCQSSVCLRSVL